MPASPAMRLMSTRAAGCASRNFMSGIRLCPPASTLASPPELARSWIACAMSFATWYSKDAGIMASPSHRRPPRATGLPAADGPDATLHPHTRGGCDRMRTCSRRRPKLLAVRHDFAVNAVDRPLPAVQRAYFYLVALVAIHMVVLAVANLLRVGAEMAMNAPSGGFTGLPFVFSDFNRPHDLYREQASLAIALLVVGGPAWWLSFRAADRAARRDVTARASAIRSFYVHLVIFVTALLLFGYGQRTLTLVLQGTFAGALPGLFIEPEWPARAAGAAAMALTSAAVLAQHIRISLADRRATVIGGRAAEVRHLALYGLAVIGLFFAAFSTGFTLQGLWH